ncbi:MULTISPECIES: nitronate monooxygenase family protein [unclassified Brevundimonas]|uniref:NAD(P)H-dependent flavin oxidoreductase n=1 Tax=unclassified Brevundimonas TaxID=2622653 RepID=UPI000CFD2C67|nr:MULTISPECIES: nitronate monooxygenase [unclassified Brevundimonas]PRA26285.1 nitronate monooxygenase [Brevundimonas sp. MYb27]PQZ80641.1 nitronate monooxygenase [Brevundimonas sp. MYb31]PRB16923.1 nitronate monooxygenase [Brevundimonas sp. MYb52]PRB37362.1 nitronate monooxygenase [Brevundimonas sp. MYb46]PRB54866.1 nitronate monooxygenase [Brevundimonas sp. MYb33]
MKTALTDRLGLSLPIIQAPMAGTSTPELAAAVSNAGALGSISIASVGAAGGRRQIQALKALTTRPFNVNVFCHKPTPPDPARDRVWIDSLRPIFTQFGAAPPEALNEIYQSFLTDDAKLAVLLDEKPAVVSFHFGLPDPDRIAALKAADCVLIASATTPQEGRLAQAAGIDMVMAQGVEAGGHRGVFDPADDPRFATLPLTRLLTRELDIPSIAAGGIMDGAGIAAALALGAAGAQLGTAFVSCPESAANAAYRAALASPRAERTRVSPVISGRPARGIENAFMQRADEALVAAYPYAYDIGKALNAAASLQGDDGYAPQWAGQAAPLTRALPAAELVEVLAQEARAAIRDLQRLL